MGRARCGRATGGRVSARQGLLSCGIWGRGTKQANTARLLCRQTRAFRACAFRRRQVRPMAPSPHGVRGCMSLTVLLTHTRLRTYNNESLEKLCMLYMIITSGSRARPIHFLDVAIDVVEVCFDVAIVREVVPCRVHQRLSLSYRGSC